MDIKEYKNSLPTALLKPLNEISKINFGENYLLFSKTIKKSQEVLVIQNSQKNICGFLLSDSEIKSCNNQHSVVLTLKTIAVHPLWQKRGVGTYLFDFWLNQIKAEPNTLIQIPLWKQSNGIAALENLAVKMGFRYYKTELNYWYEDSLLKNYQCKFCGPPPCKCHLIWYTKTL